MAKIPEATRTTPKFIYNLHEAEHADDKPRPYLGCSSVGDPCDRKVWLQFRWALPKKFTGRLYRLFDTGHREEARVLAELKKIPGLVVEDRDDMDDTKQIEVDFGCHLRGHLDAEVLGLPEAPKTWHVFDVKTIKSSKYAELLKTGIKKLFPVYWVQGMLYMHARNRERAGFLFVNKDTDEMHLERFDHEPKAAAAIIARARRIALSTRMVEPISGASPEWYACKMCDFHAVCHDSESRTVERNCRTCEHVRPLENSTWYCAFHDAHELETEYQRVGCDDYEVNKDLRPRIRERKRVGADPRRPWKRA